MRRNTNVAKNELHYLTQYGRSKYTERQQELYVERQQIIEHLQTAMNEQASEPHDLADILRLLNQVEAESARIEGIMNNAKECSRDTSGLICIGARVTLQNGNQRHTVTLVDSVEADPAVGHISDISPLGALLLNKQAHEAVTVQTPRGQRVYEIMLVE